MEPEVLHDHTGTPVEPGPKLLNESPVGDSICCHIIPISLAFAIVAVPGAELVHGTPPWLDNPEANYISQSPGLNVKLSGDTVPSKSVENPVRPSDIRTGIDPLCDGIRALLNSS